MTDPRSIRVDLGPRSYDVLIAPGLLPNLGPLTREALPRPARRAFLVADTGLPATDIHAARDSLAAAGFGVSVEPFTPSEPAKSLDSLAHLLRRMEACGHERRDVVVALGGGIVGDLAGFAAAVARRGCPLVQVPTTLLAMVDASIGGKTGVNLDMGISGAAGVGLLKNAAGSFHQPVRVVVDPLVLGSLPARFRRAGLAECLKHALIGGHANDPRLWDWTLAHLDSIERLDAGTISELVARNVSIKAAIVAGDEREEASDAEGGRALLNLGHTFGHALETLPDLTPTGDRADAPLHHGEAVGLGLVAAAYTSAALGLVNVAWARAVASAVESCGLPARVPDLPGIHVILTRMQHDKKVAGNNVKVILPCEGGRAVVRAAPPREALAAWLGAIGAG